MEITFKAATTEQDFEQIIKLQKKNLHTSINKEEQGERGFVFAEHTVELLKKMSTVLPQIIATSSNQVIGYNLAMTAAMKHDLPSITPMFDAFEKCIYQGKALTGYKFVVGGQVCVDETYRGQGLLNKLYHETKNQLSGDYEICITEISTRNPKSLKAHQKMGFKVAGTYHDGVELWNIVIWDFRTSL